MKLISHIYTDHYPAFKFIIISPHFPSRLIVKIWAFFLDPLLFVTISLLYHVTLFMLSSLLSEQISILVMVYQKYLPIFNGGYNLHLMMVLLIGAVRRKITKLIKVCYDMSVTHHKIELNFTIVYKIKTFLLFASPAELLTISFTCNQF